MRRFAFLPQAVLGVLALAACHTPVSADIEVQVGSITGTTFNHGPIAITGDQFFKFDPLGGLRRLDRVTIDGGWVYDVTVQLANPLAEQQVVRYSPTFEFFEALVSTNTECDLNTFTPGPMGIITAEPFQTVQNSHQLEQAPTRQFDLLPSASEFESMIGPGPILVEQFKIVGAFDTFRLIGGVPMGGPSGFSVPIERWRLDLAYTYHYTLVPESGTLALLCAFLTVRRARRIPSNSGG